MQKLRVGVLMGGKSIEREVSFNSGRTICDHLDTQRYDIIPLFQTAQGNLFILPWKFLHRGKISDFVHRLENEAQHIIWDDLKALIDFMYIAVHGKYAEDGTLQGFLEILGIPYLGTKIFGSALGMDKAKQKDFLRAHGICVPQGITVLPHEIDDSESIATKMKNADIAFPVIVKPNKEGSSLGVSVVKTFEQLPAALLHAATIDNKPQSVLIEEKIVGMEFSCVTITDYATGSIIALAPTEVVVDPALEFFDYEQKYMPGRVREFTPARVSQEQIDLIGKTCIQVMNILGFTNLARIDGFLTNENKIVIVDPNTLSGMAPSSFLFRESCQIGMNHAQLINHLIETELESYGMLEPLLKKERDMMAQRTQEKIRVAVLMAGNSHEREISLESGRNVCYKLSPQKYEVIPLFVTDSKELYLLTQKQLVRNNTYEIRELITSEQNVKWHDLPHVCDFVFIALHGGIGENGAVQGALEMLGLPYNGSSILTSALCLDKHKTSEFLMQKGFNVPQELLVNFIEWQTNQQEIEHRILQTLSFPLIVKPHDDGCSVMVQKVSTRDQLQQALYYMSTQGKAYALVQEYIIGTELTVGVIGNDIPRALPPSQSVVQKDILSIQEKFLPGAGENQTPAPLPAASLNLVQKTMEAVYRALGCKGYARIDCFYQNESQSPTGKERVIILEINTLPALTPATCLFHQAAEIGLKPMDFLDAMITLGFENHTVDKFSNQADQLASFDFPVSEVPFDLQQQEQ